MVSVVVAYVGPEAALPLLSLLAAIFGAILIGWRWVVSIFRRAFRLLTGRGGGPAPTADAAPAANGAIDASAPSDA